jgi:hypothetical protein
MYRHELRLVLRFGVREQFNDLVQRLHQEEAARGWATPRIWRATSGHVNQLVIEHDYASVDAFRSERAAFQRDAGNVGEVLARLSELAVPGTATEFEFNGIEIAAPPRG